MSLRGDLIRLAYRRPEHRPQLLPLLREARQPRWDKTIQGDKIRFRYADHPDNVALIEEMPGKPAKRRVRRIRFSTGQALQQIHPGSSFLMVNIVKDARITPNMSYDQAVVAFLRALNIAIKDTISESERLQREYPNGPYPIYDLGYFRRMRWPENLGHQETVSFLEVEPVDYKPIQFSGVDFEGESEWGKFRFYPYNDPSANPMEGMRSFYREKSKGGARKLFKILKANPDIVENMTLSRFTSWLDKNRIAYHYVPTVWR